MPIGYETLNFRATPSAVRPLSPKDILKGSNRYSLIGRTITIIVSNTVNFHIASQPASY